MEHGVVVRGRLRGRTIELAEPIEEFEGEVEVFVRATGPTPRPPDVLHIIATLPDGHRTKADIDADLAQERSSWTERG